ARLDVPDLELLFGASADALAGDDAAKHARRRRQVAPLTFGELIDRLEEHRAVRDHAGAGQRRLIERPLEARVANVDGEKAHPVRALASNHRARGRLDAATGDAPSDIGMELEPVGGEPQSA